MNLLKRKKKPTYSIILDFDDVIYPFTEGVMDVLRAEGVDKGRTITQWNMHEDFGMDRQEFWRLLHKPEHFDTLYGRRIEGRVRMHLEDLMIAGHTLHVVTARKGAHLERQTRHVLEKHRVPFHSIIFAHDKGSMIDPLDASFSLDDRPENYLELDRDQHLTYLMERPHNRQFRDAHPTVRRARDMKGFVDTVLGFQDYGVHLRGKEAA